MEVIRYPQKRVWPNILQRPVYDFIEIEKKVFPILEEVRQEGDEALKRFTEQFDGVVLASLLVTKEEMEEAVKKVDPELRSAIELASKNIEIFHRSQFETVRKTETMPGVVCWRKSVPIEKVGLYIPGGTAPLFSTILMLAVPARIAGCQEIILCSPPDKQGKLHPTVLFTSHLLGIDRIFKIGGAQAIAAMAYGTESVPRVDKIFGPGNQYVTAAKQLVSKEGVAIDLPAGPSEVAVVADASANPYFVAADLLSQAEHGVDSQVILVTDSVDLIEKVQIAVEHQLFRLPRKEIAKTALQYSKMILLSNLDEAMDLINEYAPEHLILSVKEPDKLAEKVFNAGSVFLGHYTPESAGDYASGTNHTLPTNGFARAYSGVSLDSFVKKITFQEINPDGLRRIGPAIEKMAQAEGLEGHRQAVRIRLDTMEGRIK